MKAGEPVAKTRSRPLQEGASKRRNPAGETDLPLVFPPLGKALLIMSLTAVAAGFLFAWFLSQLKPGPAWLILGAGLVLLYLESHHLPGMRERYWWRRTRREAGRLAKGVRRALRKQKDSLGASQILEFEEALAEVEKARQSGGFEVLESSAERLDQLAVKHLHRKSATREYIEQIGGAFLIALFLRAFFYEPFKIPSGSMIPTLLVGDHLFVNKFVYGLRIPFTASKIGAQIPNRGEVVVFKRPVGRGGDDIIKRVIGVPGDVVEVRGGRVRVNGELLPVSEPTTVRLNELGDSEEVSKEGRFSTLIAYEEFIGSEGHQIVVEQDPRRRPPGSEGRWVVREGHIFVVGDNRDNSADSRMGLEYEGGFGQIPIEYIIGRADVIWFSKGGPYGVRFDRMFTGIR